MIGRRWLTPKAQPTVRQGNRKIRREARRTERHRLGEMLMTPGSGRPTFNERRSAIQRR
jgi:hypothetical protein